MEMIRTSATRKQSAFTDILKRIASLPREGMVFLVLIAAVNLHLLGVGNGREWIFYPDPVVTGEWWRIFTHPFVHVSWYHLALDAGAFWLLYKNLNEKHGFRKLLIASICGGVSFLGAVMFSEDITNLGLCGLSGTAHGLMAYAGLEMTFTRGLQKTGLMTFLLVLVKSLFEAVTGTVVFDFMHMGLCGSPVAICHLGGVTGGIVAFGWTWLMKHGRIRDSSRPVRNAFLDA